MKFHQYFLFLILLIVALAKCADIKSTEYLCADSYAELACPNGSRIVVERIVNKYRPNECVEFTPNLENLVENRFDYCLGIVRNDDYSRRACNGEQTCHLNLKQYNFQTDVSEANCNFTSNYGKIYYSCIPNFETQKYNYVSYDVCDNYAPSLLENIDRGFIHSPFYPDYYSNNKNCYIGIKIPQNKRLVIYLVRHSMEDKSIFRNQPNDYVGIEDGVKYYGYSNSPQIIYDGNDREEINIIFVSDWITTQALRNPKGFLIYFELFSIHQPVTTKPIQITTEQVTTTVSSTTTTTTEKPYSKEVEKLISDKRIEVAPDTFSQKIKNDDEIIKREDRLVNIITLLIGFIGFLILIIFTLLFAFRSKTKQQTEEDTIYDVNDSKSIHSGNYNDEYQNVSIISTISLNKETPNKLKKSTNKQTFNDRLKKLYQNLNKTLHLSNNLMKQSNIGSKNLNSTMNLDKSNIYNPNEFNPNESDINFEKDIPIDKLKLFNKTSMTSLKKSNLEREQELEQQKRYDLNRSENHYVTMPVRKSSEPQSGEDGKLEIYEVNFENNFAYLTPANKPTENDAKSEDTEIYHSINDFGNDCKELLKDQMNKSSHRGTISEEDIYSTPSNKEVKSLRNSDNSVVKLLNHDNDETTA
ncbi:unnamed protein product [Brachionus calyciflorus]|uniref:CUB domain-containing protein n=1 Tax=Brachionus calyciflorus TaxID=104777 RepID=A0A813QXC2_9BILA|nr:unnamed protein product [Brachionus calyciflorus]